MNSRIIPFRILGAVLLAGFVTGIGAQQQSATIELGPERVSAEVSPIAVAVELMPPMEALAFRDELLDPVLQVSVAGIVELPPPRLARESLEEVAVIMGDQVFFNATLGGGSVNSVLGAINLFRVGEGPQFRLGYDHRSSDGFNGQQPGSGFFRQENLIDTWLRFGEGQPLQVELDLAYRDRGFGLQQQREYYAAEQRSIAGTVRTEYRRDPRAAAFLELSAEDQTRVLVVARTDPDDTTVTDSPREGLTTIAPTLGGSLEWPRLTFRGTVDYSGSFPGSNEGNELDDTSVIGGGVEVEGVPLDGLTLGVAAAARYRFSDGAAFPIEGFLEYRAPRMWTISARGGYAVEEQTLPDLWQEYSVATPADSLSGMMPLRRSLFASGELSGSFMEGLLQTRGGLFWADHRDRLTVQPYDEESARFPVSSGGFDEIRSNLALIVSPREQMQFELAWSGTWMDRDVGVADHSVALSAEVLWGRLGTDTRVLLPITGNELVLPVVDASMRFEVVRDIELRLGVTDALGPFETRGRTRRYLHPVGDDPFVEPGLEVTASVRVSF